MQWQIQIHIQVTTSLIEIEIMTIIARCITERNHNKCTIYHVEYLNSSFHLDHDHLAQTGICLIWVTLGDTSNLAPVQALMSSTV